MVHHATRVGEMKEVYLVHDLLMTKMRVGVCSLLRTTGIEPTLNILFSEDTNHLERMHARIHSQSLDREVCLSIDAILQRMMEAHLMRAAISVLNVQTVFLSTDYEKYASSIEETRRQMQLTTGKVTG